MKLFIPSLLILALLSAAVPFPAFAQILLEGGGAPPPGFMEGGSGAATCLGGLAGTVGTIGGWFTGGLAVNDPGAILGLFANCIQGALSMISNSVTASGIGYLAAKSKLDAIATAVVKSAIKITRDMVIRWILTGRFEGPVFSTSFTVDAAKAAENASRIFLSELTGINFCAGFDTPSIQNFPFDFDLTVACTLTSQTDRQYVDNLIALTTNPASLSLEERLALGDQQNNDIYTYVRTIDEQQRRIAQALIAYSAEYAAGEGFLGLRDEITGLIKTPGSYVRTLVEQSNIVGPQRTADVAQTVQQAIDAIIQTAVQVTIEKGLSGISGSSR